MFELLIKCLPSLMDVGLLLGMAYFFLEQVNAVGINLIIMVAEG
jgi:hypothetical protein